MATPSRFILGGVFFLSLSILLLEITFTRVFSVTMWYHFAFMAISLALLGGAVGSVMLFGLRGWLEKQKPAEVLTQWAAVFALSVPVVLGVYLRIPFAPDLAVTPGGIAALALIYVVVALPFFFGGTCIALALSVWSRSVGVLYFADLVGASLGCGVAIAALNSLGGAGALLLAGVFAACAALAFALAAGKRTWALGCLVLMGVLGWVTGMATVTKDQPEVGWFRVTSYKDSTGTFDAGRRWERWNAFSRVTVGYHDNDPNSRPFGWGLSDVWTDTHDLGHRLITIDAGAGTPIQSWDQDPKSVEFLKYDVTAMVHYVRQNARVLIIGLGGGRDALTALLFDQPDITGVEINPLVYAALSEVEPDGWANFSGRLLESKRIHVQIGDGRNVVARSTEHYDIIQAALADTWAASSAGAFSLTENSLYTQEAFVDYYRHLTDTGIVTFSRWYVPDTPGESLRLINIGLSAWESEGVPTPTRNLVMVTNRVQLWEGRERVATLLLKRTPFTDEELATIQAQADRLHFDVLYAAGRPVADNPVARFVDAPDRAALIASYPVDIAATTDDRPFFFYLFQPAGVFNPAARAETEIYKLSFQGVYILLALLAIVTVLVVVLVLVPLRAISTARGTGLALRARVLAPLAYFTCLGLGFILIEVPNIQRLVLFLGQPTYALAVVLFSFLLFSGIGSLLTGRVAPTNTRAALLRILAGLIVLGIIQTFGGPYLLNALLPLPLDQRVVASVLYIAPLGLLMGMPFPLRMRSLGATDAELVPWVWGVNGAFSVLGSVLGIFIAINAGFRVTLMCGVLCYALALFLVWRWRATEEAVPTVARA